MDGIHIQQMSGHTVEEADVEIVERKGLGHPDTICDSVMERTLRPYLRPISNGSGPSSIIIVIRGSLWQAG